tara:strand:+ start:484987 stop:485622 length:636 start_codon:yes stop_codon:yes gene_type:complete
MMNRFSVVGCLLSVCFLSVAHAEKNATLPTKITSVGSPIFAESFDQSLPESAKIAKGQWNVQDGVLVAREIAADNHAAVLSIGSANKDSVVRFSFKLDDNAEEFHFSLNHKGGHLFRVVVSPSTLAVNLDKDKKDPKSKAMALAKEKGQFAKGEWHTMQIEIVGDKVAVQTDNGVSLETSHPRLDTEKPNYRFVMKDATLCLDDLHVWAVK